jgi:hypothetical protein
MAATARVKSIKGLLAVELWDGARKVAIFSAVDIENA